MRLFQTAEPITIYIGLLPRIINVILNKDDHNIRN